MFNLKFAKTYDFAIMTKNHLNHVLEDYYIAKEDVFCVADGVTRDRLDGKPLIYPETLNDALDLIQNYPNPSGATDAAIICANTFVNCVSQETQLNEMKILEAVKQANKEIAVLNIKRKIDFMKEDYYCCVAVGGRIKGDILYCFSIGDCAIKLLDKDFDVIFDTTQLAENPSLTRQKINFPFRKLLYHGNWNWNNQKYRGYFRKKYRNNNWLRMTKRYTYGALTGEKKAIPFIKTYSVSLQNAKYILAYSDGCADCLKTKEQMISVIHQPQQIQDEMHEKTLILYEKDNT